MKRKSIYPVLIVILAMALTLKGEQKQPSLQEQAYILGSQAVELINKNDADSAVKLLDRAILLDPASIFYPYEKALAFYRKKSFKSAIRILDSLKRHPQANDHVYQLLGNCYDNLFEDDNAVKSYEEGLKLFPDSPRLYMEMGIISQPKKNNRDILGYFEKGIEADPSFSPNYYYLANFYSATQEKVWALLYAEIYLNLAENKQSKAEIARTLVKTILDGVYSKGDSLPPASKFTTVRTYTVGGSAKLRFETAYQNVINDAVSLVYKNSPKDTSLVLIFKLRKLFIDKWFSDSLNFRFPNVLFDYHKLLADNKFEEPYFYDLVKGAYPEAFENWHQSNEKAFSEFTEWHKKNLLKIDSLNYFSRFKYDR